MRVAQNALRAEIGPKKSEIPTRFLTVIVAISIVWAFTMVATATELNGTAFNSVVAILGCGFIGCLFVLTRLGQYAVRSND